MPHPVPPHAPHAAAPRPWRALLFAALGYVYLVALFGVVVLLCVLLVRWEMGPLLSLPAGLAVSLALSLWVRFPAPDGRRVRRDEAPALFRAIDRARGRLRAPEVDVVVLTTDLNAGVLEKPRPGLPGARVRYLAIGLPLMHALSEEEFHALLAHEFAHLSRQHSRSWLWLVRAQSTWKGLGAALSGSWMSFLIHPFVRWYAPRLERLAGGSSRAHEHESDRLAARAAGPRAAARSLLRLEVWQRLAEWSLVPDLLRDSATHAAPPDDLFPRLLRSMEAVPRADALRGALDEVLRHRTLEDDSHPGCAERLEGMGVALDRPAFAAALAAPRAPAAESLLDPAFARQATAELGERWNAALRPAWAHHHADALVWQDPAAAEDAARWARARWAAECEPQSAPPLLRRVLEDDPDRAEAAVLLGRLLLRGADDGDRAEGVALLERESARESRFAILAANLLRQHYARLGRAANLRRVQARVDALELETVRALHERGEVSSRDTLRPYALPPATRARLLAALEREPGVRGAFLVQKRT
ncbi:M48 family metallopeptidase, partial [Longimicrobium sp.]|uniref:M48 family metallopeptidase n=1 Tax=Longimicrobium sp. TaxID=2029185 RepID=UPI002E31E523